MVKAGVLKEAVASVVGRVVAQRGADALDTVVAVTVAASRAEVGTVKEVV